MGDVWLDAGIVPFSTLKYFEDREYWKSYFPAEYVVEMKEQVLTPVSRQGYTAVEWGGTQVQ